MRQKRFFQILVLMVGNSFGQTPAPAAAPTAAELNMVIAKMDALGKNFKSAQADLKWDRYTAVVKDTSVQTGRIFFRRKNGVQEVSIRIKTPHPKQALFKNGKAILYDPRINQTTERDVGNNSDAQSLMNIFAFGIKGQDLLQDYDVKLAAWEMVDTVRTAKLELVPRKESVRRLFSKIILWVDVDRDVAVQQQSFDPDSGDYQLAHYTNIKVDEKMSDDVFTIKKGGNAD